MPEYVPVRYAVTCAGCGERVPQGEEWGEHLATPLGRTFQRYHRERSCVERGRDALAASTGGPVKHVDPAPARLGA